VKIIQRKKEEKKYCCAYRCFNEPAPKKCGLCHKHYWRLQKERHPLSVRYNNFKSKAKQRGIAVEITLEEFKEFCHRTGYCIVKGRRGKNATIERPDPLRGYTVDNMELLTFSDNSRKGATLDKLMIQALGEEGDIPF
jgi:hypothetical protein